MNIKRTLQTIGFLFALTVSVFAQSPERIKAADKVGASITRSGEVVNTTAIHGSYRVECYGADGKLKWSDCIENVITTVGKNDILDKFLKGSTYTQTIRMGLKGAGSAVAGDTQASHGSWLEVGLANAPTYTGNRKDVVMGSASAGASVSPAQSFAITSSGTVAGCFINNGGSATIDNTTGVLISAGDFSGGSRAVINGDTINVTYTLSLT